MKFGVTQQIGTGGAGIAPTAMCVGRIKGYNRVFFQNGPYHYGTDPGPAFHVVDVSDAGQVMKHVAKPGWVLPGLAHWECMNGWSFRGLFVQGGSQLQWLDQSYSFGDRVKINPNGTIVGRKQSPLPITPSNPNHDWSNQLTTSYDDYRLAPPEGPGGATTGLRQYVTSTFVDESGLSWVGVPNQYLNKPLSEIGARLSAEGSQGTGWQIQHNLQQAFETVAVIDTDDSLLGSGTFSAAFIGGAFAWNWYADQDDVSGLYDFFTIPFFGNALHAGWDPGNQFGWVATAAVIEIGAPGSEFGPPHVSGNSFVTGLGDHAAFVQTVNPTSEYWPYYHVLRLMELSSGQIVDSLLLPQPVILQVHAAKPDVSGGTRRSIWVAAGTPWQVPDDGNIPGFGGGFAIYRVFMDEAA